MNAYLSPKAAAEYLAIHYRTFLALARREGLRPDAVIGARKRYLLTTLARLGEVLRERQEAGAR